VKRCFLKKYGINESGRRNIIDIEKEIDEKNNQVDILALKLYKEMEVIFFVIN